MKMAGSEELVSALRKALDGEYCLSGNAGAVMLKKFLGNHSDGGSSISILSDRELEVYEMIGRGRTTRQIADALHLSSKTIDTHRMHIKEKLNIQSVTELVQHAVRHVEKDCSTVV